MQHGRKKQWIGAELKAGNRNIALTGRAIVHVTMKEESSISKLCLLDIAGSSLSMHLSDLVCDV